MISFPRLGNLTIGLEALFNEINLKYIQPPLLTKQTMDLGCRYAPEGACLPFKIVLGNYLEAAELGADTLLTLGSSGPCRFGYFGALHRTILKDLGKSAEVIVLEPDNLLQSLKLLRDMAGVSNGQFARGLYLGWLKLQAVDQLEMMANVARAGVYQPETISRTYDSLVAQIQGSATAEGIKKVFQRGRESFNTLGTQKSPKTPIGIVGDIYMITEPFANGHIEKSISAQGFPTHRSIYLSQWIKQHLLPGLSHYWQNHLLGWAQPYIQHPVGGHGLDTVAWAVKYFAQGCGGVIHILPMTCMPEIVAQSTWPAVIKDHGKPILSLVLDEHAADAGLVTRVEAFLEMVELQQKRLETEESGKKTSRVSIF